MTVDLRQRRVLLTGATGGIRAHLARALADRNTDLVLCARAIERLEATAAACRAAGARVTIVAADLTLEADRARLIAESGPVEILINNAGVEHTKALVDQTDAEVRAQLELNLIAPIDLSRRLLPAMLARGSGTVVNVSSMSGKGATPYNSIYAATKHGLNGLSSSLRIELLGTGVHVGVVCPGFVAEGMWGRTGLRAPAAMREVSPAKVVAAVFAVIDGAGEVLVTAGPIRPILALRELLPRIEAPLMRRMGILRTLRARAEWARRDP